MKVKGDVDILMQKHLMKESGLEPVQEIRFWPLRKWRFDWAIFCPECDWRLAIEIEGGIWTRGRHTRGAGFVKDMEKYNKAACLGWSILRFTPEQIRKGDDIPVIREWLEARHRA